MPRLPKISNIFRIAGVYKIVCKITEKVYVGSAKNLQQRWLTHIRQLNEKIHHSIYLQRAWNKYGEINFIFEILEVVKNPTKKKLEAREQYWMDKLRCYDYKYGFNTLHKAGSNLGAVVSNKSRKLMSKAKEGYIPWNKGKKLSKQHVENLRKSHKGKKLPKKQRGRISRGLLKHNLPHRKQIAKAYEEFFKQYGYNPNQASPNRTEARLGRSLFNMDFNRTKRFRSRPSHRDFVFLMNKRGQQP